MHRRHFVGLLAAVPVAALASRHTTEQCDICGKAATVVAIDMLQGVENGWLSARPIGKQKRGCEDHPVDSHMWYGHLTAAEARRRGITPGRLAVNGVDVSNESHEFNDIEGWATVWARNEHGHRFTDWKTRKLATHRLYGDVRFYPKST